MRAEPVALQVMQQVNDPATAGDDRALVLWGLAADTVDRVEVAAGDVGQTVTPGRDGAFVATLAPRQASIVLTLNRTDGTQERITLPPPPDIEEQNKLLKREAGDHTSHSNR